ncbi:MAG: hypothetical protein OWQ50_02505, partial [Acidianus infernus]|nr:hypothetical protein [Acidianus infernus]
IYGGGLIFNTGRINVNVVINNGTAYAYSSASNSTSAECLISQTQNPNISALVSQLKLTSVTALGVLVVSNANEGIIVIVINMAPSESQMIPLANQVEGCL